MGRSAWFLASLTWASRKRASWPTRDRAAIISPVGTSRPLGRRACGRGDAGVLAQPEVYAGGGAIDVLVRIAPAEIVRATDAEKVDVVERAANGQPNL
jgi:hypothetical protein